MAWSILLDPITDSIFIRRPPLSLPQKSSSWEAGRRMADPTARAWRALLAQMFGQMLHGFDQSTQQILQTVVDEASLRGVFELLCTSRYEYNHALLLDQLNYVYIYRTARVVDFRSGCEAADSSTALISAVCCAVFQVSPTTLSV